MIGSIDPTWPHSRSVDSAYRLLVRRWGRRLVSIAAVCVAFFGVTLLWPFLAVLALARDAAVRCNQATIRSLVFLEHVLWLEFLGIVLSFLIWLAEAPRFRTSSERYLARNYRLQLWWGRGLARTAQRIYRIRIDVEGCPGRPPHPFLLFVRHTSFADTFLPVLLLTSRFGTRLRYVMKTELLWDPCLDIVGHRIPNVFVDRNGGGAAQTESIRGLARGLGDRDGVLIYPEGTRFTRTRQQYLVERLRRRGDAMYAWAAQLESVLPPRLSGALALLETAPHAGALFCAHGGLEDAVTFRGLLSGNLVGRRVRVRFWHVPAEQIPREREALQRWFLEQWSAMDRLVTGWKQEGDHG